MAREKLKLMSVIDKICEENVENVDEVIRKALINHCVHEIKEKSISNCEEVSSRVLVSIGTKFVNEVMDQLFVRIDPGVVPSFYVIKTLGDLASANPFAMTPFIKALLGTMIPMMVNVKQDQMKYVFAYTFAHFGESIQEYLANIEKAPDSDVTKDYFNSEFISICEVLLNQWINSRDNRTREQVVKALGVISALLNKAKFDEISPKLLTLFISMCKKQNISLPLMSNDFDVYFVTQSLCQVLDSAISHNSNAVIVVQIDNILSSLFLQICSLPNQKQPSSVKTHNEILRCFATLTLQYSDIVIPFILQKLGNSSVAVKVNSLLVLKHLINACPEKVVSKMPSILFALRLVLNDESNRVRKAMIQVIVAIAHHGFLDMEGGHTLIQYIVRLCAIPISGELSSSSRRMSLTEGDNVTNEDLKSMSENVMSLLVNTVEAIDKVLWPHLFEYLTAIEFIQALPVLCSSLAFLGQKLKNNEEEKKIFFADFDHDSSLPDSAEIMARLCVVIGVSPISRTVKPALKLMKVISILIDSNLQTLWETICVQFLWKIEENSNDLKTNEWQTDCLAFINQSLIEIGKDNFTLKFGRALLKQMHLYASSPESKYFLLLVLGNVARRINSKDFVNEAIDTIFAHVDHDNEIEQLGCAYTVGQCAAHYLDLVLVKLEILGEGKKSGGLMTFIMGSVRTGNVSSQEKIKSTVILCYGSITKYAPSQLLITRIETPILRTIASFYEFSKDPSVKVAFLKSVAEIATSILPENLKESYTFRRRNELLEEMLKIQKETNCEVQNELSLKAIANLIKLDPVLSAKDKEKVFVVCCKSVLAFPHSVKIMHSFCGVVEQTLINDDNALSTLLLLINSLRKWLISPTSEREREVAVDTVIFVLRTYLKSIENLEFKKFDSLPILMGILIPRCFDPNCVVRSKAFDCLHLLCLIGNKLQCRSSENDIFIHTIKYFISIANDLTQLEKHSGELAKQLTLRLQSGNHPIIILVEILINSLPENVSDSSKGSSLVLKKIIELCGNDFKQDTAKIIKAVYENMPFITCLETKERVYETIQYLALTHLSTVAKYILTLPLPFSTLTIELWRHLAKNESLCLALVDWLVELLTHNTLVELHSRKIGTIAAKFQPLAAVCALKAIFLEPESEKVIRKRFDDTFMILLLVVASYVGVHHYLVETPQSPNVDKKAVKKQVVSSLLNPVQTAIDTLKTFLICAKHQKVVEYVTEQEWKAMESEISFADSIASVAKALYVHSPSSIPSIVNCLSKNLKSTLPNRRVVPVAFFSELLAHSYNEEHTLSEPLINTLLNTLSDPSPIIRKLSIRGLGRIYTMSKEIAYKFSNPVLSALINGLEDKDDLDGAIVLESLHGLLFFLEKTEANDIEDSLVSLGLRLKTLFDKENPLLRAASIAAFGKMILLHTEKSQSSIVDQAYNNIIPFLVYLNDDDPKASRNTLQAISQILGNEKMVDITERAVNNSNKLYYADFVNSFTKILVSECCNKLNDFESTAISYLKCDRVVCQCNAITILGFMLSNQPLQSRDLAITGRVITNLISLLKSSPSPEVRIKAAESLCLI
ncbi:maestro heat-like repeat-containing protein family member 1 [Dinothrombium tinctorium]|uniref:Maestro heat-like repeat-containing protein family member 1 n=1 Tax=Dinothrombium tinctorium TaxID=1965070 RepID=A0A3S3NU76_9ACAR|nr:maestro heat-like repeat-containing protein family member 1 [Dinothrombium tinctorium]